MSRTEIPTTLHEVANVTENITPPAQVLRDRLVTTFRSYVRDSFVSTFRLYVRDSFVTTLRLYVHGSFMTTFRKDIYSLLNSTGEGRG